MWAVWLAVEDVHRMCTHRTVYADAFTEESMLLGRVMIPFQSAERDNISFSYHNPGSKDQASSKADEVEHNAVARYQSQTLRCLKRSLAAVGDEYRSACATS